MLKAIYRQLAPGATFAFAIRFPHASELARTVETAEIWHSYTDATGSQVIVSGTQLTAETAAAASALVYVCRKPESTKR